MTRCQSASNAAGSALAAAARSWHSHASIALSPRENRFDSRLNSSILRDAMHDFGPMAHDLALVDARWELGSTREGVVAARDQAEWAQAVSKLAESLENPSLRVDNAQKWAVMKGDPRAVVGKCAGERVVVVNKELAKEEVEALRAKRPHGAWVTKARWKMQGENHLVGCADSEMLYGFSAVKGVLCVTVEMKRMKECALEENGESGKQRERCRFVVFGAYGELALEEKELRPTLWQRGTQNRDVGRRELAEQTTAIVLGTVLSALLVIAVVVIFVLLQRQRDSSRRGRNRAGFPLESTSDSESEDSDDDDIDMESRNGVPQRNKPEATQNSTNRSGSGASRSWQQLVPLQQTGIPYKISPSGRVDKGTSVFGIDLRKLRIGPLIGQGANGRVFRASYLGSDVAVKEISPLSPTDSSHQEFLTELEALRRLRHPHIVELYGAAVLQSNDSLSRVRYLLVTELAPCSLRNLLDSEEPVSLMQSLRLATEIGRGCAFIHAMKAVHYDIKPANLLLSDSGKIKICDLGVSKLGSNAEQFHGSVTKTGIYGTPTYLAPEILCGKAAVLSYSVDVYAWALVFWEMLHRKKPHPENWTMAILFTKVLEGYRPEIGPLTPARIRRLLSQAWANDPDRRPEFEQVLVELTWTEQELRHPERAFLSTHDVQVWKKDRFISGRISRNRGDGTYEVVLNEGLPRPLVYHASQILLVDGGGGVGELAERLFDDDVESWKMNGSEDPDAPFSFLFRVINDEGPKSNHFKQYHKSAADIDLTSSEHLLSAQLPSSMTKEASKSSKATTLPWETELEPSPTGIERKNTSSTSSPSSSDTDELISSNDDSPTVDIGGIRIGLHGIVKPPVSPSLGSGGSELSSDTSQRQIFREDLVILNEIGRGASGRVNRALQLQNFQLVAVKSIRVHSESSRDQIAKEIRAFDASVRGHESVESEKNSLIEMYGAYFDPDDFSVKIIMEYMDGGSCHDMLQHGERPTEGLLAAIAKGALQSLKELHSNHRIHRDIKPANILIDRKNGAKLSDLGLAREMVVKGGHDHENDAMAETFVGTIAYMSPERLEGKSYSYPADIWALGVSLSALAIGKNPVQHKSFFQLLEFLKTNPFPLVGDEYSDDFRSFLSVCLQVNPSERWSASDLLDHAWLSQFDRPDKPYPQAILRAYIERAAEGNRYKRDVLNDIASRVTAHLVQYAPKLVESGEQQSRIVVPLSKVRRLSEQLGVPVRHTIKAFKNNSALGSDEPLRQEKQRQS